MHVRGEESVQVLVGKPKRNRPFWRGEDGIKMDLRETVWEGAEWLHVA
jgi:hypothetical protein